MDIDIKVLDILFRRISPSLIIERIMKSGSVLDYETDRNLFSSISAFELAEYSIDEKRLIYDYIHSEVQCFKNHNRDISLDNKPDIIYPNLSLPSLAFYSVLILSKRLLTQDGKEPQCLIDQVIPWRSAFHILGQDIFVCAFLAYEDIKHHCVRSEYTWPAVIRTNHAILNKLLQKGISENHQHLWGSSQTFALSWCNLMNYPETHDSIGKEFDQLLFPHVTMNPSHNVMSTKEKVRYACLCRSNLFNWIHIKNKSCVNCCIMKDDRKIACGRCWENSDSNYCANLPKVNCDYKNSWDWLYRIQPDYVIKNEIRRLRILYGANVPQPDRSTACIDYALEQHIFLSDPDSHNRLLAGERNFLYSCFYSFFQGEMDERTQHVFYLYIILKTLFRSELIQANKQIGFRNFSAYQDRKDILCNRPCYSAELIRMAINAPLHNGAVVSLETRISPKTTVTQNISLVKYIDRLAQFAEKPYNSTHFYDDALLCSVDNISVKDEPYFYVFHFIKKIDNISPSIMSLDIKCRHHHLRQEVKTQAIALAKALSCYPNFRQRVRGIDGASHEIGCPPEVFATAFRFLRNFRLSDFRRSKHVLQVSPARTTRIFLSATYHVGEDFLDIASALRAIDEAILFLELKRGDRIGHALGLGINPKTHYEIKGKRVYIRKQDRLDDLVWLLYRSRELGVHIDPHIYGQLKKEAEILLLEIYGHAIESNGWHITLTEYYCCMQLRADDPELYKSKQYCQDNKLGQIYDQFRSSSFNSALSEFRKTKSFAGMYFYYHFGEREKIKGYEITEVNIDSDYIQLIYQTQNALQSYIEQKGIIIECNLSSNVLIGTFENYQDHPIYRFNSGDLGKSSELQKSGTSNQLQVCINTDDLGVFDTSQEFEYALLFHALYKQCDENGKRLYRERDILQYLDSLRDSGNNATFRKV